jgi:uncharacterized protein
MLVVRLRGPPDRACGLFEGGRCALALLIGVALLSFSARSLADYPAAAGFYTKKDYEHAFPLMLSAAQEGEAEAQFTIGVMYDVGQFVAIDKQTALGWYRRAADQGHPNAQLRLGGMLFAGDGVLPDRQQAYKWSLLTIDRLPIKKRDGARAFNSQVRQLLNDEQAASAQAEAAAWHPRLPAVAQHDVASLRLVKTGTGVFVNERGSLLTVLHVAWPCQRLLVSHEDEVKEAPILTFDVALDLAVLAAPSRLGETAVFASAPSLLVGDAVSIIGYALRETGSRTPLSAQGAITTLAGPSGNEDFFWTSASGHRGLSGGPVIDRRGFVIGVMKGVARAETAPVEAASTTQNQSLAVVGDRIAEFLERSKIAFRKSTSGGPIGEGRSNTSRSGIIALVECWG